ncbi:MAG: hypothetical protein NTV94_16255, partial [Planctomycetota bacterium]|nr:hypothetical protein [Planctomycetota bacterium]
HPRYRHGSLILMLELPPHARKPEWSTPLQDAIRTSARQIASDAQWLTPDAFSNPSPSDHIRAMVLAARAISEPAESKDALSELRAAIESVANKPSAAECLRVFDESLHGEP